MKKIGSFENILVPVDDSVPCLVAQEMAMMIAKKFGSKVMILHVVSHELMNTELTSLVSEEKVQEFAPSEVARGEYSMPRQIPLPTGSPRQERMTAEISNWYHQKGDEIVKEAVNLFKTQGIQVEHKVIDHQDVADSILRETEDGSYDLIVMGRSGEKKKSSQLGGTAQKVSRHAKIPVLIATERSTISRILVPVDASESSNKAARLAGDLAKQYRAKMTLLHVQESGIFSVRPDMAKELGDLVLSRASSEISDTSFDRRMESGNPAKVVSELAEKDDYDLIIMGHKGHSSARRFLLGSVCDHVLHYANRSVLLVK